MLETLLLHPALDSSWINFDVNALVQNFWSATFDGLTFGAVYGLIAVGYTLVYGVLNLINFAHSEVFIVGAYGVVVTLTTLGFGPSAPNLSAGAIVGDLILALIVGVLASAVTAWLLERVAYRPLRKRNAPRLVFLITAIGASFAIQYGIFLIRGANAEPSVTMFIPQPIFDVFGTIVNSQQLIIVIASVILMIATDWFIRRTRTGRGIRAVAQDPDTATLMGVNKERIIQITFITGGILAGAAALFYVMLVPSGVIYNGGFILGVKAFAAAVLGGIGNVRGALLGGLLLGVIGNYGQILLGDSQWTDVVAFVVLVLVLLIKPSGILGTSLGRSRA
ncbi:amino acid/amide ABC transporter membrane protein 1, HAAT family [Leifsonia sp. 98AMF]|uniref:branched-chain amino acid ABC transporter permease n=1 Tax=Microbacteriaceae TaxID=85023 RepID=UPI000380AA08|nr:MULTISPECIES: branched-chain amino acid ABC transporter permease [Microbacteriaceae]TDQ03483.1 amino acid/amide ABC transporter membrane protein 1 (HAAT family) [Leifsonia sp. 115AMFTsu3.1]SDH29745.1 amino acid/amide ABC transporter membrane protein 1, HAAT family [Leifsonia sp. 197AMF]SDJ07432.1 amino acid/amide ABC transporter membrane protein 1, HAAT family [Leifsonia sp. 466MF]SDJ63909.1 amino acid/amide ABC transporter membrane protein 1, HAAT family [Leifsonia sp. 157MF]SDN28333.1 ami